jgi:hypothetical protein
MLVCWYEDSHFPFYLFEKIYFSFLSCFQLYSCSARVSAVGSSSQQPATIHRQTVELVAIDYIGTSRSLHLEA